MRQADTLLTDLLVLDRTGGDPLHRQLYRQIRGFILDGTLPPSRGTTAPVAAAGPGSWAVPQHGDERLRSAVVGGPD